MSAPIVFELCIDSVESAIAGHRGGADRLELCSALALGGVTPSAGLIYAVRQAVPLDVFVLIRPRPGDFTYSQEEFRLMRDDIRRARDLGANGVVFGMLQGDGQVDTDSTRELVEFARPMQVTFHRAFDVTADMDRALEDVIACGADRILTSGTKASGMEGAANIARLVQHARERVVILGAGGIRSSNARAFLASTGLDEVHTSLSSESAPAAYADKLDHIFGRGSDSASRHSVTEADVRRFRSVLQSVRDESA